MEKKVTIIGGDLRIVYLAKMMCQDGFEVNTYGLEKAEDLAQMQKIHFCISLEEALQKTDTIITAVPLSKDGIYVNTPYSDSKIEIETLYQRSKRKKVDFREIR